MIHHEIGYRHGAPTHEFKWKSTSISKAAFYKFFNEVSNSHQYTFECSDDVECSIKAQAAHAKILKTTANIGRNISLIWKDYGSMTIDLISKKYSVPPLNTMRTILYEYKNYSKTKVYECLQGITLCDDEYDRKQLHLAMSIDASNAANQRAATLVAQQKEDELYALFKSLVKCKSQTDLQDEQIIKYGRPISTPDVLFLEPVYINDVQVHWIDYKNYVISGVHYARNLKQVDGYNATYGPGAICTGLVYLEGIDMHCPIITCI
jgi:hypothetical protein